MVSRDQNRRASILGDTMPSGIGSMMKLIGKPEWPSWMVGDSRLVCWLREDYVIDGYGNAQQWTDRTANANHFTQSDQVKRPAPSTGINSKSTLYFDGVSCIMQGPSFSGLTDGECFLVGKNDNDPGVGYADSLWKFGTSVSNEHFTYSGDGKAYLGWGSDTRKSCGDPGPSLTNPWMLNVISTSSEWTANLNNAGFYSTGTNTVAWSSTSYLGSDNSRYFQGHLAEYIMFNAKLSSGERSDVQTYLQTRYAY